MSRYSNRHGLLLHKPENRRRVVTTAVGLLFVTSMIMVLLLISKKPVSYSPSLQEKWNSIRPEIEFHPNLEYINRSEIVWQIPRKPKAVLFIAHGCHGSALNFWDRSPNCLNCIGLPEERLIVLHAILHHYAVITISSSSKCWSFSKDKSRVKRILKWWTEQKKLGDLPVVALGASSGGYFVSALASEFQFAALTIMISEGVFDDEKKGQVRYPPTLFVHMPKDAKRAQLIAETVEMLRSKGVEADEVKCHAFALTPSFLSDRIPGLDEKTSMKVFQVLKQTGTLNEENYMVADGRQVAWRLSMMKNKVFPDSKTEWDIHIQEELNLAFGYHEMTSLQSQHIFYWFDTHLSA